MIRDAQSAKQHSQVLAVILFAVSILMACLVLIQGNNLWFWCHSLLLGLFGDCAILWPILLLYISVVTAMEKQNSRTWGRLILMSVVIILFCACFFIFSASDGEAFSFGIFLQKLALLFSAGTQNVGAGVFGGLLGIPLVAGLGVTGAKIVILLALFVALMILTRTGLMQLFHTVTKPADMLASGISTARERKIMENNRQNTNIDIPLDEDGTGLPQHPVVHSAGKTKEKPKTNEKLEKLKKVFSSDQTSAAAEPKQETRPAPPPAAEPRKPEITKAAPPAVSPEPVREEDDYQFPPVSMLETTKEPQEDDVLGEIQTNGHKLESTLLEFGVRTKFIGHSRGPAVTRYELQPDHGVKISKITNLSDDIAMRLETTGIRIEAPIPGKAAVGIEVPNRNNTVVRMRELIQSSSFTASKSALTVVLGRRLDGSVAVADLSKMPHLLIAGSTGSGKSVCINSMIISLLYKSSPARVRFLMIDPKVVELGIYNGIPHLLVPVVTDPRKAAGALSWAVTEMMKRYKLFAENNVRDISAYNILAEQQKDAGKGSDDQPPLETLPQIVLIIDELADLMMAAPKDVEDSICRLAQMARAAGMHLVIATQRPSVDVITGTIKTNIPSRIAFAVSSQVDSRTILDMGGAEKLLGRGDMLFSPVGSQKPMRIQGCFVSDSEIESVSGFVKNSQQAEYSDAIAEEIEKNAVDDSNSSDESISPDADPMLNEAIKYVVDCGQASTSSLQRRFRLGYARAGRLMDEMEQMNIVGPSEGSKPRQVLISRQQWLERSMQQADSGSEQADS